MAERVWLVMETTEKPPWNSYVVAAFLSPDAAQTERKRRQRAEDEYNGAFAEFRYAVESHWLEDAHVAALNTNETREG